MRTSSGLTLSVLAVSMAACTPTRTLVMNPVSPPWVDASTTAPELASARITALLVVPPVEDGREDFLGHFTSLRRSLAQSGVEASLLPEDRMPGDVDGAVRLAAETTMDAVLVITGWRWLPSDDADHGRRYFVHQVGDTLSEVDRDVYEAARSGPFRYWYGRRVLDLQGRVVAAGTGTPLATLRIQVPRVRVSDPLVAIFRAGDGELLSESYSWSYDEERNQQTVGRATLAAFRRVGEILSGTARR